MSVSPRQHDHLVPIGRERAAVEAPHELEARKPCFTQEQLHLEAIDPAQRESVLDLGLGAPLVTDDDLTVDRDPLERSLVTIHVVDSNRSPGLGMDLDREL